MLPTGVPGLNFFDYFLIFVLNNCFVFLRLRFTFTWGEGVSYSIGFAYFTGFCVKEALPFELQGYQSLKAAPFFKGVAYGDRSLYNPKAVKNLGSKTYGTPCDAVRPPPACCSRARLREESLSLSKNEFLFLFVFLSPPET